MTWCTINRLGTPPTSVHRVNLFKISINWFNKAPLNEVYCDLGFNFCGSPNHCRGAMWKGVRPLWVVNCFVSKCFSRQCVLLGLETVDVKEGCEAGKSLRYQCKDCTCDDDGKSASCPKWIKCCKLGEIWSTNACNMCYCDEKYQRICKAVSCLRKKS